jgi:hypothetical protein
MAFTLHDLGYEDSKNLTSTENRKRGGFDRNLSLRPEGYVYVFSVSQKAFLVERPPLFPKFVIPACPKDREYIEVAKIPNPYPQAIMDWDKEKVVRAPDEVDNSGVRVAIDLIDPNNLGYTLDWSCPADAVAFVQTGAGTNLARQGVFIDLSPEPSKEELEKAKKRRHGYYEGLRVNANLLEKTRPKDLATEVFFNDDYHMMADYFGLEYAWHAKLSQKYECPNCGDSIAIGIAFHKTNEGDCVIDWKRYFLAGRCTKQQYDEVMAVFETEKGRKRASGEAARS